MRLLAHRSFMLQMSVSCWPPFFTLSALLHGRVNLWFIYMHISCKGTQNLRYPNAVEKFFSLHGIGLRLHVEGEYAFSHHEIIYPSYRTTLPLPSSLGVDGDGADCAPLPSLPAWL